MALMVNPSTETNLRRGINFAEVLIRLVKEQQVGVPVNLLLVGVGSDEFFHCGYEPYNIFARLEDAGIDYQGMVVDLLPGLVNDFQRRRDIFFSKERYGSAEHDQEYFWRRYLDLTTQKDRLVDDAEALALQRKDFRKDFPTASIRGARIPAPLERKLEEGTVQAIPGNVETFDLRAYGPFNAVSCTNVLYHFGYKPKNVLPALRNLTSHVCQDGFLYLDLPWVPVSDFELNISKDQADRALRLAGLKGEYDSPWTHSFRKTLPFGRPRRTK